jgi:hypothetical protein
MSYKQPFTPEDIAAQSIAAAEAGESILHLHARDPIDGHPTPDPAVFMQFLTRMFMKETADRLFGVDYRWSVLAAGRAQIPFATQAAMMGGNVRVGIEGLARYRARQTCRIQRRAGRQNPPHSRGTRARHRDAGGGARNPGPKGRRPGGILARLERE